MTIWIENTTTNNIFENYQITLEDIIKLCLLEEKYPENIEVSLTIIDNKEIQRLNHEFRNIDRPTDVLSFPMLEFEDGNRDIGSFKEKAHNSINNDTNEIVLGDILISIEKAIEQANEFGHSLQREIAFLTAHSMFHLMGYDHIDVDDEVEMGQKQEKILEIAGLTR